MNMAKYYLYNKRFNHLRSISQSIERKVMNRCNIVTIFEYFIEKHTKYFCNSINLHVYKHCQPIVNKPH